MYFEEGINTVMEGVHYFHKNYKKIYGQIALRFDNDTYLQTGGNKLLCEIKETDITMCDIKTGDLGKLFTSKPDINVFIFGCTPDSVEASNEGESLPVALDDMAHLTGSKIKIAADANPDTLLEAFEDTNVCLVKGSGFTVVSETIWQAAAYAQIIEKSCEAFTHCRLLGGLSPIKENIAEALKSNYYNTYLKTNINTVTDYVSFNEESYDLRKELKSTCDILMKDELIFGSWGNVSARLDENTMLITPSAINSLDTKIEDLTRVHFDNLKCLDHMLPSSSSYIHAKMYQEIPNCNAIIHTHSNACSIFAACAAGFTISDKKLSNLIGDVKLIPYIPESKRKTANKTAQVMQDTHAAIMANQGAIFYGPSLSVVLEVAQSVEILACKILELE